MTFKDVVRQYLKLFRPARRQGQESSQYRAAIFYDGETQKREAGEVLSELGYSKEDGENLLEPAQTFYAAEVYHQKYYEKMMGARR